MSVCMQISIGIILAAGFYHVGEWFHFEIFL